MKNIKKLH